MYRIAVCMSLLCLALGSRAQQTSERGLPHASPCPAVYSYGWEPAGGWHGVITILPPARFSEVRLVLRLTVPYYRPEAGVGRVEVKGGTPEIQAISRRAFRGERHKIQFMIIFPPFDDVPRVKEIFFNGKSFCVDSQVYADTRSTIELKYTLRSGLNLPLANGDEFSVVSAAPSRPDLVTVAILQPTDEARPMVSSPQSAPDAKGPSRPGAQPVSKPPCKCSNTRDREEEDLPMQHRPENHVFHAFKPPAPSIVTSVGQPHPGGGGNNFASPPPTSANPPASADRPPNGNKPGRPGFSGNNFAPPPPASVNRPPNGNKPGRPGFGGNNFAPPPPMSANRPPNANKPGRPGFGGNNFAPPPSASSNRPPNANKPGKPGFGGNNFAPPPSASSNRPPPPSSPAVSNQNEEVDDKIYFIMTDSDEANSPRIVRLLEHLLTVSKKHYQVDLERLEIEKKRLSLEKYPHYTFVV